MNVSRKCRQLPLFITIGLIFVLVNILTLPAPTDAWPANFFRGSRIGYGRNIRPIHCVEKKKNIGGICMFAWDCMKMNGTHLDTCIDRFYFGSCCQMKAIPRPPHKPQGTEIETNELEENAHLGFGDYSMDLEKEPEIKPGGGAGAGGLHISMASKHPDTQETDIVLGATFSEDATSSGTEVGSDSLAGSPDVENSLDFNTEGSDASPDSENSPNALSDSDKLSQDAQSHVESVQDSESTPGSDSVPVSEFGSDTMPALESGSDTMPALESGSDTMPALEFGSDTMPSSESGSDSLPFSESGSDSLSSSESGSDSLPSSESGSDFVPAVESGSDSVPSSESGSDSVPSSESGSDSVTSSESGSNSVPSSESGSESVPSSESGSDSVPSSESGSDSVPSSESGSDSMPALESGSEIMLDSDSSIFGSETGSDTMQDSGSSVLDSETLDSVVEIESVPDEMSDSESGADNVPGSDSSSAHLPDSETGSDTVTVPDDNLEPDLGLPDSEADSTFVQEAETDAVTDSKAESATEDSDTRPDSPATTESLFNGGAQEIPDKHETSINVAATSEPSEDYELKPFGLEVITSTADAVTEDPEGVTEESHADTDDVTELATEVGPEDNVLLLGDTSVTEQSAIAQIITQLSNTEDTLSDEGTTVDVLKILETLTTFEDVRETEATTFVPFVPTTPTEGTESSLTEDVSTDEVTFLPFSTVGPAEGDVEHERESSTSSETHEDSSTPSGLSEEEVPVAGVTESPEIKKTTTTAEDIVTEALTTLAPLQVEETTKIENSWNEVEIIDNIPSSASPSSGSTESSAESAKISIGFPDEGSTANTSEAPSVNVSGVTSAPVESMSLAEQETLLVQMLKIANYKDVCGKPVYPISRIVGGLEASYGEWPWQVSLRQWRSVAFLHKCGSALVNENWAITAAHCVEGIEPDQLLLVMGEFDLGTTKEPYGHVERSVQVIAMHPKFEPRTFEYDLALLRFSEPITFQPNIIPICIPDDDYNFLNETGFVTGWGRLYEDGPLPTVMQKVPVPVIPNKDCEGMYKEAGYIEHIPNIFICAGYQAGKQDSCEGDSGGPMVINYKERWRLAGIISWGIGCAVPNQPGVYTRISEFREWINKIIRF